MLKIIGAGEVTYGGYISEWYVTISGALDQSVKEALGVLSNRKAFLQAGTSFYFGSQKKQAKALEHIRGQIRREGEKNGGKKRRYKSW